MAEFLHFSFSFVLRNNNYLYYALAETLAFLNLFGSIKGDVYCNGLGEMCLIFVYDRPKYFFLIHRYAVYCITLPFWGDFVSYPCVWGNVLNLAT